MAYQKKDGKRPGVILFYDWQDSLEILAQQDGEAAVGRVILALLDYARYGEVPTELSPTEQMLFSIFRERTDAAAESYRKMCEKNAQSGAAGGRAKAENERKASESRAKTEALSVISSLYDNTRGNTTTFPGLSIKTDITDDDWVVYIPTISGEDRPLRAKDVNEYASEFPTRNLKEEALNYRDYLLAAGEKSYPKYAINGFTDWLHR